MPGTRFHFAVHALRLLASTVSDHTHTHTLIEIKSRSPSFVLLSPALIKLQ